MIWRVSGEIPPKFAIHRERLRRLASCPTITWTDAVTIKLILDTILARLDALETAGLGRPRRRLSKAELAKEESCTPRTVDRRVEKQNPAAIR